MTSCYNSHFSCTPKWSNVFETSTSGQQNFSERLFLEAIFANGTNALAGKGFSFIAFYCVLFAHIILILYCFVDICNEFSYSLSEALLCVPRSCWCQMISPTGKRLLCYKILPLQRTVLYYDCLTLLCVVLHLTAFMALSVYCNVFHYVVTAYLLH